MLIQKIINDTTIFDLVNDINAFCSEYCIRENDDKCLELRAAVDVSKGRNDYLLLLSSYLSVAEDGDEIIEALYEFISNCKGFCEPDEETTVQITKEDVNEVLDDCESKCQIKSCVEQEHKLNLIEINACQQHREFSIKQKGTEINLLLPRVEASVGVRKYIAEELGKLLYDVLKEKLGADYIFKELNRYIPETREVHISTRNLFAEYFYDVVLYKERKPGIYPNFDDHMKRVLTLGFFEKIIGHYLKE